MSFNLKMKECNVFWKCVYNGDNFGTPLHFYLICTVSVSASSCTIHDMRWRDLFNLPPCSKLKYIWNSDQPNVRFSRIVRMNFYCSVRPKWQNLFLQNIELFPLLYIAFFKMATLDILSLTERWNSFVEIISDKNTVQLLKLFC